MVYMKQHNSTNTTNQTQQGIPQLITLPDKTITTAASIAGAVEGLYDDTAASEDNAAEEAVCSVLVDGHS